LKYGTKLFECFASFNIRCDLAQKLGFSSIFNAFSDKRARNPFVKQNIQFVKVKNQIILLISALAEKEASKASVK
jgi:hypothetical protein